MSSRFISRLLILALTALGFLHILSSTAAEIDSVTTRGVPLDDSRKAINAIFNARLRTGVAQANPSPDDFARLDADAFCDPDRLHSEIRKAIFDSLLPRWGLRGYDLDRQMRELLADRSYALSLNDSIYRDVDFLEGLSLRLKALSDVVVIDGQLVGLDKIGHFFAEGWRYFEHTHDDGDSLEQAMQWGSRQEAGKFGYDTTGIFSFADLVANFNGWRFWNEIRHTRDDPLKRPVENFFSRPYVVCDLRLLDSIRHLKPIRTWKLTRAFDLRDYVDGAWDEGNNCNSYADPTIEAKVVARIQAIDPAFRCPLQPAACHRAREKYGEFARVLLHPRCLTVDAG
jgi:hypothetical protein